MAKKSVTIPPKGIDQLSDEIDTPIRKAINVDLDKSGKPNRRKGATLKLSGAGYHSLYTAERGWIMLCHKEELGVYTPSTNAFTILAYMAGAYLTSFTELNGNLYACNPYYSCMFLPDSVVPRSIGVQLPAVTPQFGASAAGGLAVGTYGISFTIVDSENEESALGPIVTVELPTGGGITALAVTPIAGAKYRIYMTPPNGAELRQITEFDATVTTAQIGDRVDGRLATTQHLAPLPFGHIIRNYGSRLFVGSTNSVYFSDAFRPHLYNPAHNFIPITGLALMVQPVDTGIFIGDRNGVHFYEGGDADEFKVIKVADEKVIYGTAIMVPTEMLDKEYARFETVAMWLSTSGYQIGLPTGEVVPLNATQVALPSYAQGCATTVIQNGRKQVITPVDSSTITGAGIAQDSVING